MKIYCITSVEVIRISDNPLALSVRAQGLAATSGWTNPKLDAVATPPGDLILEFNFEADPPSGISLPVLTPIAASAEVEPSHPVAGVIVYGRTNSITVHVSQFTASSPAAQATNAAFTTLIAGEEHPTTYVFGEEHPTTLPIGEEHPTTFIVGEEHPTTLAVGEEHPTTLIAGEENPTTLPVGEEHPTTLAIGEEHPTTLIAGEENPTTTAQGEEVPTNPQLDDPAGGFTTLAVGEEQGGGGPFGGY